MGHRLLAAEAARPRRSGSRFPPAWPLQRPCCRGPPRETVARRSAPSYLGSILSTSSRHGETPMSDTLSSAEFNRRRFLAGATAAGLTIVRPELVAGTRGQLEDQARPDRLRRPRQLDRQPVRQHGGYQFIGTADYFPGPGRRRRPASEGTGRPRPSAACPATNGCWTPSRTPS